MSEIMGCGGEGVLVDTSAEDVMVIGFFQRWMSSIPTEGQENNLIFFVAVEDRILITTVTSREFLVRVQFTY